MDSIALFLLTASITLAEPPEARFQSEQDEHAQEALRLLDRGDYLRAIPELEKSRWLFAKTELIRVIGDDDPAFRLRGISKFEPERMKALAELVLPEVERMAKEDPRALISLSVFHFKGIGAHKDPKKGFALLEEADMKGVADARVLLGASYIDGNGVEKDARKGARLIIAEADRSDDIPTIAFAGALYLEGIGVEKDLMKARQYLDRAFRLGSIDATLDLANLEIAGLKPGDLSKYLENMNAMDAAHALYLRAALAGRVDAKMHLASTERTGGITSRPQQGFIWVESAAESGLPMPLLLKACSLYEGWGCKRDDAAADRLIEEALAAARRYELSEMLEIIEGVPKLKTGDERAEFIASKLYWKELSKEFTKKISDQPFGMDGSSGPLGKDAEDGPAGLVDTSPFGADDGMSAERMRGAAAEKGVHKPAAKLRVVDSAWQATPTGRYVKVFGRVRNVSKEKLDQVWVDVIFESAKGRLVAKGTGVVQPSPLLPGEVGAFEVMEKANPAASKYKFIFRELLGGSIPAVGH